MKHGTQNKHRLAAKLPKLILALGPAVIAKMRILRRFLVTVQSFESGAISLRKAHRKAVAEGWTDVCWETWRAAAAHADALFSEMNLHVVFKKPAEGFAWTLGPDAETAARLAAELVEFWDGPHSFPGAA